MNKNKIAAYLDRKTILVTGATGFLGQPLVEKILWASPGVQRVYVLIRPKRQSAGVVLSAQQRLEKELYESSVFDRIRAAYGSEWMAFLREKLVAVPGDIGQDDLGIDPESRAMLQRDLDIVINSAAVVSFDAPLDQALLLNVHGARRVATFAASCDHTVLVHVSTAYVAGASHRIGTETIYHSAPESRRGETFPAGYFSDLAADQAQMEGIIARVRGEAESAEVDRSFTRALMERARAGRGGRPSSRRKAVDSLRRKWIENRLTSEGMSWARQRGWNDTYTYTKAMGEQMVMQTRGSMPTVILRPSVIESSLAEPIPGWLDGLRMADPLIAAIGKGRLRALPMKPDVHLDLVPVDMVVNALLASIPHAAREGGLHVYQVATGSRNPITLGALYDLIYRYFIRNPMLDKAGNPIRIRYLAFPNPAAFRLQHRLRSLPLEAAEKTLEKFPGVTFASRAKRRVSATKTAYERLYYYGEIYEPYLNMDCRFEVDNLMALHATLSPEEQQDFAFDVTHLNWRYYIQHVHIPGIKKYILKLEGDGRANGAAARAESEAGQATTIPELLARSAARFGTKTVLQVRRGGRWERVSFTELHAAAERIAAQFRRMGLDPGDRVVLFSENQPEWGMAYLGAVTAGLVVVPLDAQTWHREVWSVARFVEARALLVSESCLKRLPAAGLQENEVMLRPLTILDVNRRCAPLDLDAYPRSTRLPLEPIQGTGTIEPRPSQPEDTVSIIFTSGTASDPRGAMHTHRSFLANVYAVTRVMPMDHTDQLLSVLPLYHALEFSCGFLAAILKGSTVTYAGGLKPKMILETMRETGTTMMLGVPTLYALLRDDLERRILKTARSGFRSSWLATSKNLVQSLEARLGRQVARSLFARIHSELGGKLRYLVSGGSALGPELYEDFKALGIPIYEGYGLTETAPVVTVNWFSQSRAGSVGKTLPGVELRISRPDRDGIGEIVVRTPSLMQGYYKNPVATSQSVRAGWLHTGDLGWVDEDGYVFITGRIKDVIVTGAGKNVYPGDLESIYAGIRGVQEIAVVGLRSGLTEDLHAVLVPRLDLEDDLAEVKKRLQRDIATLGRELPSYHRLQVVHVWRDALPRTPAGAIDRAAVRAVLEATVAVQSPGAVASADTTQEEPLLEILARLSGRPVPELRPEHDLATDLGLDSLEAIEVLLFVEAHYGITVPDAAAERVRTVADALQLLRLQPGSNRRAVRPLPSELTQGARPGFDRALHRASLRSVGALYRGYFGLRTPSANGHFPRNVPYILAANHASHLDLGAILTALSGAAGRGEAERLHVLGARDYFFDHWFKTWFFSRCFNVVPIRRDRTGVDGLRAAKSILASGEPVLIFPEATRSRTGRMQAFKPGLGLLALEAQVPIVPAYIHGTYQALPAGRFMPRRTQLAVRFGAPIAVPRSAGLVNKEEHVRHIADEVRRAIESLARDLDAPA